MVFQKVGQIPFSYKIVGNKIKPIGRDFTINTALKYDEWQTRKSNLWLDGANPYSSGRPVVSGNNYNTATPSTVASTAFGIVDVSTLSPDTKVSTEKKK